MIDRIRASRRIKRRELERAVSYDDMSAVIVDDRTAERSMIADQELKTVVAVIDALPASCQQAFILNRFDGLTYAEIAKEMKISTSMVERHIGKALFHLSASLK